MSKSKASVIILSWNGLIHLQDCLSAVLSQSHHDSEVIVVDNGSEDGSADFVAKNFPSVQLIRNTLNLGFAAGNNIGLRKATGDILVLLNQDTIAQRGWLDALCDAFDSDPHIGIVGCKAKFIDGRIQHAGAYINSNGLGVHYHYAVPDVGLSNDLQDVDYVIGASLAITRKALDTIGNLDEGFTPAYYEDVDWCYRARRAGFRVVYTPHAIFTHKECRLAAENDFKGAALVHRNRLRFVLKHWPLERLINEFEHAEREWLESLGEGSEVMIAAIQHAYFYHLLHLNDVVRMRVQVQNTPGDEVDTIAGVLMRLRAIVPLRPARFYIEPAARSGSAFTQSSVILELSDTDLHSIQPSNLAKSLDELQQHKILREFEFRSSLPIIGPLVSTFRHLWNNISAEWSLRSLIQQQTMFNIFVVEAIASLTEEPEKLQRLGNYINQEHYDRERLGEVLGEYIRENGREIASLIQELNDRYGTLPKATDKQD